MKNKNKYQYNSFIFGSSRTIAFRINSWKKYLKPTDNPFKFDASGDSIYGIWKKIVFLNKNKTKIDNALIVIDKGITFVYSEDQPGHLFIKHPLISGNSWYNFHRTFFTAYIKPGFLFSFFKFKLTNKYDESMEDYIEKKEVKMDPITNEMIAEDQENEIINFPTEYYEKRKDIFYPRKGETISPIDSINVRQIEMMREIVDILKAQNSNYKVIISPLYDQVKFSPNDQRILNEIFVGHIYDFSGENEFTSSITNYYETSHYRPHVGDSILSTIYRSMVRTLF
jgi:hypothetical protein